MRGFKEAVWVSLVMLTLAVPVWSQATASLTGTVTDPTGAVVPRAQLNITNPATGVIRTTTTASNGVYVFPRLDPATYRLEVTAQGFKTAVRERVIVQVGLTSTLDVQLEVGAVAEVVEVEAATAAINTSDASIGNVISGTQIRSLPILNLDPAGILSLQPGVTFIPGAPDLAGGYSGASSFDGRGGSVNGSRSDQTNITLDGIDVNDPQFGFAFTSALRATQASLQEFRVTTTNYNADLGRSSAGQVQLVTKSGSNEVHGSAYWTHRNEAVNANEFFKNRDGVEKGKFHRHIWGAALGGPIVKDRFFLFGNFEELRHAEDTSTERAVPSLSFRDGVEMYRCTDRAGFPACPTTSTTVTGLSGATYTVPAGHYGLTPAELAAIDPLGIGSNAAALTQFANYPTPNSPGTFDRLNIVGFRFGAPIKNIFRTYIARADFNLDRSAKHTLYWRGTLQDDVINSEPQFPGLPANQKILGANKGFAMGYKALLSPTVINEFRWGITRIKSQTAGLQDQEFIRFRFISDLQGYSTDSFGRTLPQYHFRDDLSWIRGKHTLGIGADLRFTRNSTFDNSNSFHFFTLNPSWLPNVGRNVTPGQAECDPASRPGCGAVPAVSSAGIASYRDSVINLLGVMTQATAFYNFDRTGATLPEGASVLRRFAVDEYEGYIQDQWRASPALTITYGLRYFVTSPPWETRGNQVTPTPSLGEWFEIRRGLMKAGIASNKAGQISFDLGGPANNRPGYYPWDWNNFSPRAAVAWAPRYREGFLGKLFGDGKMVIRGGYSLVFDRIGNGLVTSFNDEGSFGMSTSITSTFGGCDEGLGTAPLGVCPRFSGVFDTATMKAQLLPPSPGGSFPATPPGADLFGVPQPGSFAITSALNSNIQTPYSHMINVSIARELPGNFAVEAAYVGRRGRKLLMIQDLGMPADLCDAASNSCYFDAASRLIGLAEQGQDILSLGPIPYWENLFPSFGPSGINGGFLACDIFGVDPGGAGGFSATQVAYDWINCVIPDTTVFPWAVDNFGFPGYVLGGPGDIDVDGDGLPDAPFAYFDDQFATVTAWSSIARSEYHALELMLRKRMSHGVQFDFNYTLSHSLDHSSTPERADIDFGFFTGGYTGSTINSWSPDLEYSNSDFDMRHQINANWVVELPFGRGKTLGGGIPGWADQIIGGWLFSGIFRWNSELPANVIHSRNWPTNWNLQGNATCFPGPPASDLGTQVAPCPATQNVKNGVNDDGSGRGPNLFARPEQAFTFFRSTLPGQRGERNVLRADDYFSLDLAIAKTFSMPWEGHRLTFRWDTFNLTNSVYFDAVSLSASIGRFSTFGDYSAIMGTPRQMQFSLRYDF